MCNCKRKYSFYEPSLNACTEFKEFDELNSAFKEDFNDKTENKVRNNADLQGLHRIKVWVDEKYKDLSEILDKFESEKCDCEEKTRTDR